MLVIPGVEGNVCWKLRGCGGAGARKESKFSKLMRWHFVALDFRMVQCASHGRPLIAWPVQILCPGRCAFNREPTPCLIMPTCRWVL